ncbi:RNA polymerase sigma-70 factor, ECF subfamily [Flavobacteriaceae bacterium MAR_2010_188]|nr:RNA polymerase sigma-70 factor, ECF subfamily [Flavobacteriaceae bacterium MAR_2010_188]
MSLEQLIDQCKKEDAKAQSQIYKLFASKLFSVSLKYSKNYVEAEDTLHDAFVTIFNKISQYKGNGSFEGWMKRITVNTALQKYRGAGVFNLVNENQIEDVVVEIDEEDLSMEFLLKIIQELPDRYRLVFNMYALDGYSHKEISKMLDISVGGSKSNLSRARLILKEKIEDYRMGSNLKSL